MAKNHSNHTDSTPENAATHAPDKPASFVDKVKENSLKNAGWAYMIADASLVTSGVLSGRHKEAITGAMYMSAGAILARYGKLDGERELKRLNTRLAEHLKEEGIDLPDHGDISAETLAKKGGIIEKIEDFLYQHPSQTLNAIYSLGGMQLASSGVQHSKPMDLAAGAFVTSGALSGLLMPEAKEPAERTGNPITDTANWFREKPLRISGGLYMLNNFALIGAALGERKANPEQKSYMFKLLTASIFMVANTLLGLSSKDAHSSEGSEVDTSLLYEGAAKLIARQPDDIQHDLIQRVSGYLATENTVEMSAKEIAEQLTKAINAHRPEKHTSHHKTGHANQNWQDRARDSLAEPGLSKA